LDFSVFAIFPLIRAAHTRWMVNELPEEISETLDETDGKGNLQKKVQIPFSVPSKMTSKERNSLSTTVFLAIFGIPLHQTLVEWNTQISSG